MSSGKKTLTQAIALGAVWVTGIRMSHRIIGFVSTIILARLLTPDDFGIVAIAMSFYSLASIISRLGFQTALIQNQDAGVDHYNTAWTLNALVGVVMTMVLFGMSGFAGDFYDNDDITSVLLAISPLFFLEGIKNIGVVDFQKEMTFDKEFKLIVIPKFISFFVTLGLALYFLNFWALIIGNLFWKVLEVIASYWMHPFRPRISFVKSRELFSYTKWLMINNVFAFVFHSLPELLLGKLVSLRSAGVYALSYEIGLASTTEIVANINRAIYPGYAKVASNLQNLRNLYKDSIKAISVIALPLGVGVSLVATDLVAVFLGDQWGDAAEPLIYLALGGCIDGIGSNVAYIYYAVSKPRLSTLELALKAVITVTLLFYLIPLNGVVGAAQSYLIGASVSFLISWCILRVILKLPIYQQFLLYVKPIIACLIMAAVVMFFKQRWLLEEFQALAVYGSIGAATYILTIYLMWRLHNKPPGIESQIFGFIGSKLNALRN